MDIGIKRVVYECEQSESNWDGSDSRSYMGESWIVVGTTTDVGQVSSIMLTDTGAAMVRVEGNLLWMVIPAHKICRWFFI